MPRHLSPFPSLFLLSFLLSCSVCVDGPEPPRTPRPVEKTNPVPVWVHYMPWFESLSHDGAWGSHWTMANANPSLTLDGLPDIAAHFHPLIDAYSSHDPHVLEYHALLMKYCGVDAAIVDWYGTHDVYDYARLDEATEKFRDVLKRSGLRYGLM